MKMLLPVVLLISMVSAYAAEVPADDAEFARRILGTWFTDPAEQGPMVSTATYYADGTGVELVRGRDQPESASIRVTTRWSIKNGLLSLKSITSSDPKRIPVGVELKDRIVSLSEDRFVFEAYEGYSDGKGTPRVKVRRTK